MSKHREEKVVAFGFNTDFQRQILSVWSPDSTIHIKQIPLSKYKAPNAMEYAEMAFASARKIPRGRIGNRLKLAFLEFQYNWIFKCLEETQPSEVLIYNGLNGVNYLANMASQELDLSCLFFERAPLQDRIQIDSRGVNFNSSVPRSMDFYNSLNVNELPVYEKPRYIESRLASPTQNFESSGLPLDEHRYVFCPLQVPRDTQITVFGGWIRSIDHLLTSLNVASEQLPTGWHIRIKEHPSSPRSFREQIADFKNPKLVLDTNHDVYELMQQSSAVLTINSSVGLEAFTLEKTVITLGDALYSFGDLTTRASGPDDLASAFRDLENLSWSRTDREIFLRFLNFWYPTTESVLNGSFGKYELTKRTEKFESWFRSDDA